MNFQVELNNYCNFTCGYCPNKDMERKRQFMNDDVWQTILHKYIVPYRHLNAFCPPTFIGHKDSEPLLDRKFQSRLRDLATATPDMTIDIYSNGVLLPAWRKRGEDLFAFLGGLPCRVRYMMSYHPVNHDYSVNEYAPTVAYLQGVLRERRPSNVEFITVSHRSKWVSEEVQEEWVKTWAGYPITVHKNCSINPWTGLIEDATCVFNGCPYGDFGHWFFGVTGNVIACCLDLEEEIVLGNVMTDSPAAMFDRTEAFYALQRKTKETNGPVPHQVCANCFGQKRTDLIQLGVGV